MANIANANSIKELGLANSTVSSIVKLYNGTKKERGLGVNKIAAALEVPRRRVMRALELKGAAEFSPNSYT